MEWMRVLSSPSALVAVVVGLLAFAAGMIGITVWANRADARRVKRFLEAQGGTVLSAQRVNDMRPRVTHEPEFGGGMARFKVRWVDGSGRERVNTFLTSPVDSAVWTGRPALGETDLTAELEARNAQLREISRRRKERLIVLGAVVFVALVVVGDVVYTVLTGRAPTVFEVLAVVVIVVGVLVKIWLETPSRW